MAVVTSTVPFSAPGRSHCMDLVPCVLSVDPSSKYKALWAAKWKTQFTILPDQRCFYSDFIRILW